jgi:hypothetical protein
MSSLLPDGEVATLYVFPLVQVPGQDKATPGGLEGARLARWGEDAW